MLENIPKKEPFRLDRSVNYHRYQVCSRSVCSAAAAQITILAFDAGDGVSAEEYSGDTLYTVLDGSCTINAGGEIFLERGKSLSVPAGELHSVAGSERFSIIQTTINKGENTLGKLINHIPHKEAISLKEQIDYEPGQVVSMTLTNQPQVGMTLFAFDQGTKIGTHAAPGDAMPTILEGEAEITISGATYTVKAGESIVMPAGEPHSLTAVTRFKMLLVLVKS